MWLWQVAICMTMALPKLLLSRLWIEFETPAARVWVTSRRADVEDGMEARHTTSGGARSAVVAYWNDGTGIGTA
ncbi:hypothetical protein V501_00438 [Pseudogymnoascus sp. VKM F-4519 (FW-2642)]|nr:hypothetical protein V501_00438 [Pseudogymnoascus sp. VKM F-4519 (FW-2642)]